MKLPLANGNVNPRSPTPCLGPAPGRHRMTLFCLPREGRPSPASDWPQVNTG